MNATDLKTLTDVEVVSQWLAARGQDDAKAVALLAESERRGSKRIVKAFAAVNASK